MSNDQDTEISKKELLSALKEFEKIEDDYNTSRDNVDDLYKKQLDHGSAFFYLFNPKFSKRQILSFYLMVFPLLSLLVSLPALALFFDGRMRIISVFAVFFISYASIGILWGAIFLYGIIALRK